MRAAWPGAGEKRGWDGWTRTSECGSQSPVPYRLATPQYPKIKSEGPERTLRPSRLETYGVGDGTRTRDTRNHNPMLYQLNYTHHIRGEWGTIWHA